MIEQYSFAYNGNIQPCPYRDECRTYKVGCQGISYWCGQMDIKEERCEYAVESKEEADAES